MTFCEECGGIMVVTSEDGISFYKCQQCGWLEMASDSDVINSSEKLEVKNILGNGTIQDNISATYDSICSKCGYDKAEVFEKACKVSDEMERKAFLKCGKCGNVERMK